MKRILFITVLLVNYLIAESQRIVQAEYFVDIDKGVGNNDLVTFDSPQTDGTFPMHISLTGVSAGFHQLYIRAKNDSGIWSLTSRKIIEVIPSPTIKKVTGAEYFFKTDPGIGNATKIKFSEPQADGSFSFKIPVASIPVGANTLFIRAEDSANASWSLTQMQKDSVVTSIKPSLWSQPATWSSNKVPDSNTVVLLYHNVTVDIVNAVCKSLATYGSSVQCIIDNGKALKITGHK